MPTETIPSKFLVFVSGNHWAAQNNLKLSGAIVSAGVCLFDDPNRLSAYLDGTAQYAPYIPDPSQAQLTWIQNPSVNGAVSFGVASMSERQVYDLEYEGEVVRLAHFPRRPSRFTCVYAFESQVDCELASKRHGWKMEEVKQFTLMPGPLSRVHRASMDLSSLLLSRFGASEEQRKALWDLYWSGGSIGNIADADIRNLPWVQTTLQQGEHWEYLIEGKLLLEA